MNRGAAKGDAGGVCAVVVAPAAAADKGGTPAGMGGCAGCCGAGRREMRYSGPFDTPDAGAISGGESWLAAGQRSGAPNAPPAVVPLPGAAERVAGAPDVGGRGPKLPAGPRAGGAAAEMTRLGGTRAPPIDVQSLREQPAT